MEGELVENFGSLIWNSTSLILEVLKVRGFEMGFDLVMVGLILEGFSLVSVVCLWNYGKTLI